MLLAYGYFLKNISSISQLLWARTSSPWIVTARRKSIMQSGRSKLSRTIHEHTDNARDPYEELTSVVYHLLSKFRMQN